MVNEEGTIKGRRGDQSPSHYFPVHQAADFCFSCRSSAASQCSPSLRVKPQHMAVLNNYTVLPSDGRSPH